MRNLGPISAVLFDWDGTLADSLPVVTEATNRVLASHGYAVLTDRQVHVGMRLPTLERMALHAGLPLPPVGAPAYGASDAAGTSAGGIAARAAAVRTAAVLADEFYRVAESLGHNHLSLFSGVRGMLDDFRRLGLPMAVVSNNRRSVIAPLIANLGLARHFPVVIGEEDVPRAKPDPSGLLAAAASLGVRPMDAVYVGDSRTDAEAARNAGIVPVGAAWPADSICHSEPELFARLCRTPRELVEYVGNGSPPIRKEHA